MVHLYGDSLVLMNDYKISLILVCAMTTLMIADNSVSHILLWHFISFRDAYANNSC